MATATSARVHDSTCGSARTPRSTNNPAVAKNTGAKKLLVTVSMAPVTSCVW